MISIRGNEHLGLVAKPAEGDGMDQPIAVPLENVARAARAAMLLAVKTAARCCRIGG
jgi:hypothetical protein